MIVDRRRVFLLAAGDFCILLISLWLALSFRKLTFPSPGYFLANAVPFVPLFLLSLAVFYIAGLYEKQTRPILRVMGVRILGAQIATVIIGALIFFFLPLSIEPRAILVLYLLISVLAESLWRTSHLRNAPLASTGEEALLIGKGPAVEELYEEVHENPRYLITFAARIDSGLHEHDLAQYVQQKITEGIRILVVDASDASVVAALAALYASLPEQVQTIDFASLYEEVFDRVPLDHQDPVRLGEAVPRSRTMYDTSKRLFDVLVSFAGGIIVFPVVLLAALAVATSGTAPLIRPARIGRDVKAIRLYKLRTMLFDDKGDPELQKKNRVTSVGKFLRKTRIDELPQLLNVFAGDLSFIGPRPEIPNIVAVYEREIPFYRMRHTIIPGLSGWAQIHDYDAPRGPADIARTRKKLSFDLYYLKHRSIWLDLEIALKSARALLAFSGT